MEARKTIEEPFPRLHGEKTNKTAFGSKLMAENSILFVFFAVETRKKFCNSLPCFHDEKNEQDR
jgi:hypothetical protein